MDIIPSLFRRSKPELLPANTGPAVDLKDVTLSFGSANVLSGVSMVVERGERVVLSGASGSGKTTLFNVIRGTVAPDTGSVRVLGDVIHGGKSRSTRRFGEAFSVMRRVGIVTQVPTHIDTQTPVTNATITSSLLGIEVDWGLLDNLTNGFGLGEDVMLRDQSEGLSGGQRARLGVIAALMKKPELLLLDEAASGLSPTDRQKFSSQLTQVCEAERIAVLAITHDELPGFPTRTLHIVNGQTFESECG